MVKVRFAPSPTGIPHVGNTRTALFNYLFARHNNGKFILRIEDTDRARFAKEGEEAIIEIMSWLGLDFDEKFVQSERLKIYKEHAQILEKKKIAYKEEGALKFRMPKTGETSWQDSIGNKKIVFKNETQEDFVIIKSDGYPTYNFANVVDDYLMGITHIIRGEEFISSTPKHVQLYRVFAWEQPGFAHLPIILGTDKAKLSKRHGAKSVLDYREEGYLKETLLNYMALLGWNPGGDQEIFSLKELIKLFDIEDINTANPIFDFQKLEWLNGVWIRKIDDLKKRLIDFYSSDKNILSMLDSPKADLIIDASRSRMKTLRDFKNLIDTKKARQLTKQEKTIAGNLLEYLENKLKGAWKDKKLLEVLKEFSSKKNVPFKKIYFLMTGRQQGIGILELNQIYGKDFFVKNLKN